MADEVEKAVLCSLDASPNGYLADPHLKAQATHYLQQVSSSPEVWKLALQHFTHSSYVQVKFWALQVLSDFVNSDRVSTLTPTEQGILREELTKWVTSATGNREAYLKNKLSYAFVCLIRRDYPEQWPGCFQHLVKAVQGSDVGSGDGALDMLCRILATLDEEVISLEFTRSSEEIATATRIKDALKIDCLATIVELFYRSADGAQEAAAAPPLLKEDEHAWVAWEERQRISGSCIDTLQRFIGWIDIGMVANPAALSLLMAAIKSRHRWQSQPACECYRQMILKGMPAERKVALLDQLQVGAILGSLVMGPEPFQDEGRFEGADGLTWKLASLTSTLWEQLVALSKETEGTTLRQGCQQYLNDLFPVLSFFAQHESEEVAHRVLPTLGAYVNYLRTNEQVCDVKQMNTIFQVVYQRLHHKAAEDDGEQGAAADEEDAIFERELFHIFRSLAKLSPTSVSSAIGDQLQRTLYGQSVLRSDVESALSILMQAGEALPNHMRESDLGVLGGPVSVFFNAHTIPYHQNPRIAEVYMELTVRYCEYLKQNPSFLPRVLLCFMDHRGLRHPSFSVQSRASYLLTRLARAIRQQLLPYLSDVMTSLQEVLTEVAETPVTGGAQGADGEGKSSWRGADDRVYAFEAAGLIVGQEQVEIKQQAIWLSAVVEALCSRMKQSVEKIRAGEWSLAFGGAAAGHQIAALGFLSKGFQGRFIRERQDLLQIFVKALEVSLSILPVFPPGQAVRGKVISMIHRMVECLRDQIMPYLLPALQPFVVSADVHELADAIALINQMLVKFKGEFQSTCSQILPELLSRIFTVIPSDRLPALGDRALGKTQDEIEVDVLHRAYIAFLHTLGLAKLHGLLLFDNVVAFMKPIVLSLAVCASSHEEMSVRKLCVSTFASYLTAWTANGDSEKNAPGFVQFAAQEFVPQVCIAVPLGPDFNAKDAASCTMVDECMGVVRTVHGLTGDAFLHHLASTVLPQYGLLSPGAEGFCEQVKLGATNAQLRTTLLALRTSNGNGHGVDGNRH